MFSLTFSSFLLRYTFETYFSLNTHYRSIVLSHSSSALLLWICPLWDSVEMIFPERFMKILCSWGFNCIQILKSRVGIYVHAYTTGLLWTWRHRNFIYWSLTKFFFYDQFFFLLESKMWTSLMNEMFWSKKKTWLMRLKLKKKSRLI